MPSQRSAGVSPAQRASQPVSSLTSSEASNGIPAKSGAAGTAALPSIEFGEYVRAGDRYEVLKPPYQVVKNQEATPRGKLNVVAAKLDNDGQTLVLTTDPHSQAVRYALTIPGVKGKRGPGYAVDVDYSLQRSDRFLEPEERVKPFPNGSQPTWKSFGP
jgi:hypothetical protein